MSNFNTTKWFRNQYIKEHIINESVDVNLKDLTFDMLTDTFKDKYKDIHFTRKQPNGEEGNYYRDAVSFPNPDDSLTVIGDVNALEGWKERITKRYGDVDIELFPEEDTWFDMVKIKDEEFKKDKESYIDAKGKAMDDWSKKGYSIDEKINEENEKFDHIARAEYGKPWTLLSIAQKQEMLKAMNKETEKQFQTDYEERRKETSDYMNEMDMNDPVLVKMRADKVKMDKLEKDQEQKIQNLKRTGAKETPLRKLANIGKIAFLEKEREQLMRDMEQEAEPEGGPIADEYGRKLNRIDQSIAKLKGRKEMTYDQAIAEGHSLEDKDIEVLKDAFNVLFVQNPDWKGSSDLRRIIQNLIDTNDTSGIQEIAETIKLGEGMIEEELCAKGKAYRKRRIAAGEKSSAYLSGRAVKVCKGQMNGKKKKK